MKNFDRKMKFNGRQKAKRSIENIFESSHKGEKVTICNSFWNSIKNKIGKNKNDVVKFRYFFKIIPEFKHNNAKLCRKFTDLISHISLFVITI